jgi:hypothetical protein
MRYIALASIIALAISASPLRAEVSSVEGKTEIDLVRKGQGYECETATVPDCKPGQICYGRIQIMGEAARELYEAMRLHGSKVDDFSGEPYVGTQTDALTCWEFGGEYGCAVGYNALTNTLSSIGELG